MKKYLCFFITLIMALLNAQIISFAEREYVGDTSLKDNMLFINGNSIPAAQLPNQFVYIKVDELEYYGFDVEYENIDGNKNYIVKRNENKGTRVSEVPTIEENTKVFTTNARVYIDSEIPANVFELENGTVLVQSDELAKYGTYNWSEETHTISIHLKNSKELPPYMTFQQVIGIDDINAIKYGVIVDYTTKKCADIDYEDLKKWLDVYWNFSYDRVIAPLSAFSLSGDYIKLWNTDKSKAYIVYPNGGVIVGRYGEPYESHGEIKQNYIWYLPYIGNARNALYHADMTLHYTYLQQVDEIEYKGANQREFTQNDDIEIPQNNVLITDGASSWAIPEIEKAAACNLMVYDLSGKYSEPITRLEFSQLLYRLITTEFEPNTDSRMGIGIAIQNISEQRGITNRVTFSDCSYPEVENLASMGIIAGIGDGAFAPDEFISREQAATLLYRTAEFLGNKTIPTAIYGYSDAYLISDWALSAVMSIKTMGIMHGVSETEFAPKDTYTVEQAIATMFRLYECS